MYILPRRPANRSSMVSVGYSCWMRFAYYDAHLRHLVGQRDYRDVCCEQDNCNKCKERRKAAGKLLNMLSFPWDWHDTQCIHVYNCYSCFSVFFVECSPIIYMCLGFSSIASFSYSYAKRRLIVAMQLKTRCIHFERKQRRKKKRKVKTLILLCSSQNLDNIIWFSRNIENNAVAKSAKQNTNRSKEIKFNI